MWDDKGINMLHIIFLILKIILFIILGILSLALLLLLIVLFVPVRYKAKVIYKDKAKADIKVRFLFVSLKLHFDQERKEFSQVISIAGFKLRTDASKPEESEDISKEEPSEEAEVSEDIEDTEVTENTEEAEETEEIEETESTEDTENIENAEDAENHIDMSVEQEKEVTYKDKKTLKAEKKEAKKKKRQLRNQSKIEKKESFDDKMQNIKKKINRFKKFWNLSYVIKTRAYLKKYMIKTIKHIMPYKIKGYVRYGLNEPCKTGQLTGYLSLFPIVYQKDFSLYPDFYNKILEADVYLKGRIRLGYILRIVLNKNVWKTIKAARRI